MTARALKRPSTGEERRANIWSRTLDRRGFVSPLCCGDPRAERLTNPRQERLSGLIFGLGPSSGESHCDAPLSTEKVNV